MSSAEHRLTKVSVKADSVDPDQTAPVDHTVWARGF